LCWGQPPPSGQPVPTADISLTAVLADQSRHSLGGPTSPCLMFTEGYFQRQHIQQLKDCK
jgi:hypothetical protein